jgi:hypothetical protein
MTRAQIVEELYYFTTGNWHPEIEPGETIAAYDAWLRAANMSWLPLLLDIVRTPPDVDLPTEHTRELWRGVVAETIANCGKDDPLSFLRVVGPKLIEKEYRKSMVLTIGLLGSRHGLDWFEWLVDQLDLTPEEVRDVLSAIDEISEGYGERLLRKIRDKVAPKEAELSERVDKMLHEKNP